MASARGVRGQYQEAREEEEMDEGGIEIKHGEGDGEEEIRRGGRRWGGCIDQ